GIERITSGNNFSEIKIAVQMFISTFLETSLWDAGTIGQFQFCLDTLNDLEDASVKAGDLECGSSCDIWLSAIDDRIYVKRSETTGISIFPYRVGAGSSYAWHFIPGFSQDSSLVVKSKYLFLKDNQRDSLPGLESEFTEAFINLYNLPVENVIFSYSTDSFSGPALPPSSFVLEKAVSAIESNIGAVEDEYRSELGYWAGDNPLPDRIFPVMQKGTRFALVSAFSRKKIDYTKELIVNPVLQKALTDKLINEKGNLSVSPSSLDQFSACPYLFLFQRGLGVDEDDYKEVYIDHPVFGQLIHECFDRFFKYVDGSSNSFSPSLSDEYKTELNSIIDNVFNRYSAIGKDFIAPVWKYCREFTRNKLISFIEVEGVQFPGFRLAAAEKKYSCLWKAASPSSKRSARPGKDSKVELTGRIDRVSFKGDKTAIIDYKKKNHLKKADMNTEGNGPSTFQIPFYIYLVEKSGLKVSSASYYDVTNCKYDHVYNPEAKKSWCSEDEMALLIDKLEKSINFMDKRIKEGNFSVHPDGCGSCSFRR
ncbi:MAG: PD-(D/E)XK nuclease family protein, partial [Spirochaetales bacterium]|nr:PD-(D/E)XK nuclease family protein [Spirochaetales bacterium]